MELKEWFIIICVAVLILSRFIPVKGITNITIVEAKEMLKGKNIQFIDVRTPGEYNRYHLKPFRNIPLYELAKRATSELDNRKLIVVICQSGIRSGKAARVLKKRGFPQIYNVKGGMAAWKRNESKEKAAE